MAVNGSSSVPVTSLRK